MKKISLILAAGLLAGFLNAADEGFDGFADEGEKRASCENFLFTVNASTSDGTYIGDLLDQFATDCGYSILIKDKAAKKRLASSMASINIVDLPLEKIFDLLLTENELNYEFDGKLLKISYLVTETFKINYIGTSRVGKSTTDIILSQKASVEDSSSGSGGISGGGLSAVRSNEAQNQVYGGLLSEAMAGSSSVDSISGTKIVSADDFDFWGRIEEEIFEIAFRPGDAHQPIRRFSTDDSTQAASSSSTQNADGANAADGSTKAAEDDDLGTGRPVIVNKTAGFITVTGTNKQIERVRKYLKDLEEQLQNQVLIDVNILTVTHTSGNTIGIDWSQLWNVGNLILPQGQNLSADSGSPLIRGQGGFQLFSAGMSVTRIMEFLNSYGKVRSVSNPKVLTLSNQPALISVGSILRYSQSSSYITATSGSTSTSSNENYPSVFSGVLLDVTPSIQGEYIMLKINPSITRTKDTTTENAATALQEPPNLSASQLSSLIRARDGDKIVIGGLISKSATNSRNRVPFLGYVPILKYLFSYDSITEETTEMVIIITPHIIKRNDNPSLQDLGYSETVNEVVRTNNISADIEFLDEE